MTDAVGSAALTSLDPSGATPLRGPLRVLCVDDNHDAADSMADLLTLAGAEARACYGGADALDTAAWFEPRVCLVDLTMPGMDGCELAGRLLDLGGGHTFVLVAVTALGDAAARGRTKAAGFDLHLVKPVNPNDLLAVLADVEWWLRQPPRD